MQKRIATVIARQILGQIMDDISIKGNDYIVERWGKPLAAIISMEKYSIIERELKKTR